MSIGVDKVEYLEHEYRKYSKHLIDFEEHINFCFHECIFKCIERDKHLKTINKLVKEIIHVFNDAYTNIDTLYAHSGYQQLLSTNKPEDGPFQTIHQQLLNLGKKIGFKNITHALTFLIQPQYETMLSRETVKCIQQYETFFVPLTYRYSNENNNAPILIKRSTTTHEALPNDCLDIHINIRLADEQLVLTGFFKPDPLQIVLRTSQICNTTIYNKKIAIHEYVNENSLIDANFTKTFLKCAPIVDYILLSPKDFLQKMENEYAEYLRLSSMTFVTLVNEYINNVAEHDKFKQMYKIIRILLLGSNESANIASLFHSTTNDKRHACNEADMIYKNLSYIAQQKLRKTSTRIRNELERIQGMTPQSTDYRKQIAICKGMPNTAKREALLRVDEIESDAYNGDHSKPILFIDRLLRFPWPTDEETFFTMIGRDEKKSQEYLDEKFKLMEQKFYGQPEFKEYMKGIAGKWLKNEFSRGNALAVYGPPGVGKTHMVRTFSEIFDIPFIHINLGGQNDGELLFGHGYTYTDSRPGIIISKMCDAEKQLCIVFCDELGNATQEIQYILMQLTDPETNQMFQDRFYQGIDFSVTQVIWIFSYNNPECVIPPLRNRIEPFEIKGYNHDEKIIIAQQHLLPEMCKMVGFEPNDVAIRKDNLNYIIDEYTNEAGVRELKRKIEKIILKTNLDRIYHTGMFEDWNGQTVYLSRKIITKYLGQPQTKTTIHKDDIVGVVNGLCVHGEGQGGILPIQIYCNYVGNNSEFTLKMTGLLKKVMRQSIITAFNAVMALLPSQTRLEFIKENPFGLHIHAPEGAIPKDGPSAGCAFATAFMSRILNKKIRHDVAMTGEITLTGKITRIGGLRYKLLGAKKAGVKIVLISSENKSDYQEFKEKYPHFKLQVQLVSNIRDVLKIALVDYDTHALKTDSATESILSDTL